jgi:hypothetical protein
MLRRAQHERIPSAISLRFSAHPELVEGCPNPFSAVCYVCIPSCPQSPGGHRCRAVGSRDGQGFHTWSFLRGPYSRSAFKGSHLRPPNRQTVASSRRGSCSTAPLASASISDSRRVRRLLKKAYHTLRQAQGERKGAMKSGGNPLMLSLSKHGVGFFSSLLGRWRPSRLKSRLRRGGVCAAAPWATRWPVLRSPQALHWRLTGRLCAPYVGRQQLSGADWGWPGDV